MNAKVFNKNEKKILRQSSSGLVAYNLFHSIVVPQICKLSKVFGMRFGIPKL